MAKIKSLMKVLKKWASDNARTFENQGAHAAIQKRNNEAQIWESSKERELLGHIQGTCVQITNSN